MSRADGGWPSEALRIEPPNSSASKGDRLHARPQGDRRDMSQTRLVIVDNASHKVKIYGYPPMGDPFISLANVYPQTLAYKAFED